MKVDWDELKRLHQAGIANPYGRWAIFMDACANAFPAILAEREAAREFRDIVAGLACCDVRLINEALAAFDKETQNEG